MREKCLHECILRERPVGFILIPQAVNNRQWKCVDDRGRLEWKAHVQWGKYGKGRPTRALEVEAGCLPGCRPDT